MPIREIKLLYSPIVAISADGKEHPAWEIEDELAKLFKVTEKEQFFIRSPAFPSFGTMLPMDLSNSSRIEKSIILLTAKPLTEETRGLPTGAKTVAARPSVAERPRTTFQRSSSRAQAHRRVRFLSYCDQLTFSQLVGPSPQLIPIFRPFLFLTSS